MGPAIKYADGFSIYRLNGVRVPKELVMAPAEDIECKILLSERNAEIRREIIKKVGIDRVIKELGAKSIEKRKGYELLNFQITNGEYRPYLKMINPSTNDFHIEGVHPNCDSIDKALAWRNHQWDGIQEFNGYIRSIKLT